VSEERLIAFAHVLGEVSAERDTSGSYAGVVRWDLSTQVCASRSQSRQLTTLSQALEECESLLCLQETDLEVRETILVEELECGLHPSVG
jgi:hypothetical protein